MAIYILGGLLLALLCLCAGLGLRLYGVERGVRGCVRQLRAREEAHSSVRLRLEAPSAAAEALLAELNHLLELRERDEADYRAQESALRRQISNVSHDLRTPLTSILGYLQLLEGDSLTPEERREYLGVVESRAKALQSLITSFYDLSRLDGGEYALKREPVDLSRVLSGLLASFYNDFTDRDFDVQVELEEGLPPVKGDEGAVLRVLTNLIRNALEHGEGALQVSLRREGARVAVTFRNRAAGLEPEDISHIFDRFYTGDKMRTGRSTGLGLAIVKGLAGRMGADTSAALEDGWFSVTVAFPV